MSSMGNEKNKSDLPNFAEALAAASGDAQPTIESEADFPRVDVDAALASDSVGFRDWQQKETVERAVRKSRDAMRECEQIFRL